MRRARLTAACLLAACAASAPARADEIALTLAGSRLAPGGEGGGGGIEWERAFSPARRLRLGASGNTLAGERWFTATAGLTSIRGRDVVTLAASGGGGDEGGFVHLHAGVLHGFDGARVAVGGAAHYVGGRSSRGGLAQALLTLRASNTLLVQADGLQSFAGSLRTSLVVAKVVRVAGPRRVTLGGSLGRTRPFVLGLQDQQRPQRLRQVFAAVTTPLGAGRREATLTFEHYWLESTTRQQLALTFTLRR